MTLLLQETQDEGAINSGGHHLGIQHAGQQLESNTDHVQPQVSNPTSHSFDPDVFDDEDDNTFVAQGVITEYLEKHFRRTLSKANRTAMHKAHPVPRTFAAKPPVVDKFVKDYLKSRYPKQDGELAKLQSVMLKVCGRMTCMWSDLIEQDLLEDPDATISVHNVLEIIQRSLVLLRNANEMLSQMRRTNLLELADKSLGKYAQDSPSQAGEFLFGPEFAKHLQDKVEADVSLAKVVATSQRYHPYNNKSRTTTIGRSKQQFFEGALLEVGGHSRANPTPQHVKTATGDGAQQSQDNPTDHQPHRRDFESATSPPDGIQVTRPRFIINHYTQTHPSRGQAIPVYTQLGSLDQRPLGACNGQGIPLTSFPLSQSGESSRKTHDGYNKGESTGRGNFKLGRKRGSSSHQETSGALNQSPICGSQKQRRVATNYRPTTINVPKSVLTPSKQIDFLGFTINTSTMTISLPVVKKVEIQRETSQLLRCPSIQTRTLACLLGKLVATKPAVFIAPLHYCALQSLKISALHAQQETVALSPEATDNLKWWSTQLHRHCSSPILKPEASTVITSDASLKGWGAACQERTTGGLWSTEEACFHINLLELKAAYLALQCFLKETVSTHVLMRLDNRTAIAYLNRMGGPSFSPLCQLAIDIWNWCLARQITLHAEYLPGTENTRADWESRHHHDSSNWKLCPSVFEALNYLMGPLSIDLFASRINYQLPVYCSWKPDPGARTVDAFSISWARETPYLFPPFCLIGRALSKISREAVDSACLVAPAWPSQIWYPQLLAILTGPPILLPTEDYLLLSPDQRPHPLQLEGSLCLTAWPISGNISRCKGFLQELQSSSLNHGEATPMMPTTQHGASGFAGVLNGISIPFQHL